MLIDAVLVVNDIIVIYRKNETILILISLKRYKNQYSITLRRRCNFGPWRMKRLHLNIIQLWDRNLNIRKRYFWQTYAMRI